MNVILRAFIGLAAIASVACGSDNPASGTSTGGTAGVAGAAGSAGSAGSQPTDEQILAATWEALPNAPSISGKQDDLYFVTPEHGFSVNGLGRIYETEDGGDTWTLRLEQPGTFFRAIVFVDAQRGFAANIGPGYFPNVTDPTPLYATSDGGDSWAPVTAITGPMPTGICNFDKLDDQHLYASGRVGGPSFFLSSTDGGQTWVSRDLGSQIAMLIDVHFVSPTRGFLIGGSSTNPAASNTIVLATNDGGETWQTAFQSTAAGELGWKFSFPSPSVGYASVLGTASPSTFLKTTDGGESWQALPLVAGPYATKGIGFITENIGWVGGDPPGGAPAYRTADGGQTWQEAPALGALVNRFRFVGGWTGYGIGTTVYKLSIDGAQ